MTEQSPTATKLTVIVPVYNVARYLDDFLGSLERQTYGMDGLQVVLVDDGSTDDGLDRLRAFAERHPGVVEVHTKPNGGQASARNLGLEHARGEWVTFPDSDDILSDDYLQLVADFIDRHRDEQLALVAAHPIMWREKTGKRTDSHVLSFRFRGGDSVSDLTTRPEYVQPHVTSAFFRTATIRDHGLRFDERLRTRFEDGSFLAGYLLACERPILGLVSAAHYIYRIRQDGTSTVQNNTARPQTYTDVPKFGYHEVMRAATVTQGGVPLWLQTFVLYDLFWLLRNDHQTRTASRALTPETQEQFHYWVSQVMKSVDPSVVYAFDLLDIPRWFRDAVAHGYRNEDFVSEPFMDPPDTRTGLMPIRYRYRGTPPAEELFARGRRIQPRHAKTRELTMVGRVMLYERTLWVPTEPTLRLILDGRLQLLHTRERRVRVVANRRQRFEDALAKMRNPGPQLFRVRSGSVLGRMWGDVRAFVRSLPGRFKKSRMKDAGWAVIIRLPWVRAKYEGAWLLMDKDTEANDSAEQLYRWIAQHHPETKLFYVVNKTSSDWKRLKGDGFRLIGYRSWRWKPLVLLAGHVVSSHIDGYIANPLKPSRYGEMPWKVSFLQHGIIKGDLSPWLNGKDPELVVASTEPEYDYLTGVSPYKYSTKEVRLTGLPRHDALLAKDRAVPDDDKRLIVLAPTWRKYLVGQLSGKSAQRTLNDGFLDSEFARRWQELLTHPRLHAFAADHGLTVAFLPHPNIQPYLDVMDVPEGVRVIRYDEMDVQDVIAHAAAMVTDYSSMAFNMAYLYRPVCYYQFDRAEYEAGHTEGPGYFSYDTDGFGPVAPTADGIVDGLVALWERPEERERFALRARATFPVRDGRNAERVYLAIRDTDRDLGFDEASRAAGAETWASLRAAGKAG